MNECNHKEVMLEGFSKNEWKGDTLVFSDPYLECKSCKTHLMCMPDDIRQIVNVPHYEESECPHRHEIHTMEIGEWVCLNCGRRIIKCPEANLEVKRESEL